MSHQCYANVTRPTGRGAERAPSSLLRHAPSRSSAVLRGPAAGRAQCHAVSDLASVPLHAARSPAVPRITPLPGHAGVVQRACACGGTPGPDGLCDACRRKAVARMGTAEHAPAGGRRTVSPMAVERARSLPPAQLPTPARMFMEARFGRNFSDVNLHAGPAAAAAAGALRARAFTVGRDVFFGAGQYSADTRDGQRLIAHELAHVIQQAGRGTTALQPRLEVSTPGDAPEREADDAADTVMDRRYAPVLRPARIGIQRACGPALGTPSAMCEPDEAPVIGQHFAFVVDCDDLQPGEAGRVAAFASTLKPGTRLRVHGYASDEGPAAYNLILSCHRANRMADLLRAARPDCPVSAPLEHGEQARAPGRAFWRSVIVEEIRPAEPKPEGPEDCAKLIGSCEFYRCRQRRTGNSHAPTDYYLGYGLKYCLRFSEQTRPRLSHAGKMWLDKTLTCLHEHIQRRIPYEAPPGTVKRSAFDSHPGCYVVSGLCFLDPSDWQVIWDTIDSSDNDLKQVLTTAIFCGANLGVVGVMPMHSLAAGGGYAGLHERDMRRAFARGGTRPFPPVPAPRGP
jgi:outer membrane protein OmpA-like peptidoglycan-associated protein